MGSDTIQRSIAIDPDAVRGPASEYLVMREIETDCGSYG